MNDRIAALLQEIQKDHATPLEVGKKIAAILDSKSCTEGPQEFPTTEAAFSYLCHHWSDYAHRFDHKYIIYYKSFMRMAKSPKEVTPYIMNKMLAIAGARNTWIFPDTKRTVTSDPQPAESQTGHKTHKNV